MNQEWVSVEEGAAGLMSLVGRATGLDASASARFRERGDGTIDVFVTTPFDVIAARRIVGEVSRDGAVVAASDLLNALQKQVTEVGTARDPNWPGSLPPQDGFRELDVLPVTVVRQLADDGQALTRQFSGPLGPPASLLDQTVITVTGETGTTVDIPMRMVFACINLGLIPSFSAGMDIPRHLRVAGVGRWVRIDSPFGSVYRSGGLGNVLVF